MASTSTQRTSWTTRAEGSCGRRREAQARVTGNSSPAVSCPLQDFSIPPHEHVFLLESETKWKAKEIKNCKQTKKFFNGPLVLRAYWSKATRRKKWSIPAGGEDGHPAERELAAAQEGKDLPREELGMQGRGPWGHFCQGRGEKSKTLRRGEVSCPHNT